MKKSFLLISMAIISLSACHSEQKEEKKEAVEYIVTTPIVKDTAFTKEYVAQIQSLENVELHAQERGYLETMHVEEGRQVKKGQLLFTIMPRLYEAEYQKAAATTKIVELELQNVRTLAEKNIVSKTELGIAEAKLKEAQAEQNLKQVALSFTKITAPFSGTVDRIPFKKGSLIEEGTVLTTISNNSEVFAYFNVSEIEYLDYKSRAKDDLNNQLSLVLSNGTEHKFKGFIETIESEFDNTTGNIAFRAKFPNPELLLKHGETGKVRMRLPIKNAMIIPQKATYELQDKICVFVIDDKGIAKTRVVKVRQRLEQLYILESGLAPTDKILLEGVQSVKDDDKIEYKLIAAKEVVSHLQLIKK
jgi:membrane fusion protein, multidrug efflux system